jgi:mono/diheme cytochrome c family protein
MQKRNSVATIGMIAGWALFWTAIGQAAEPATPAEVWRSECSGCHIAYAPRLLPAASWREIIRTLDKHFGVDASVEPAIAKQIAQYLDANAGRDRGTPSATTPTRITEQRWFKREHDEVANYWGPGEKIAGPSDCAACHVGADQGRFSEHDIKLPK